MAKAKKDINKDLMFQKIMPSADTANKKSDEIINIEEQKEIKENDINSFINHSTSIPKKDETYVINLIEKAVTDNLDSVLERFKCCKCDKCKKDMIALALNSIPPKYVVVSSDKPLPDTCSTQNKAEIATAIVRAIIKVKAEPKH